MIDWEKEAKKLENKVLILQDTLETVKKMELSHEIRRYIHSQEAVLKLVDLVNLVSDKPELDVTDQKAILKTKQEEKKQLDKEINLSVSESERLTAQYACDPRLFGFEIESAVLKEYGKQDKTITSMLPFAGKGVRITSYAGKQKNVIILPEEIEGYPVISIGKSVFEKMPLTNIVLPKSLRAIYDDAFNNCQLLKHIDLPEELVYLGESCFYGSGIESISIPSSVKELPTFAFAHCGKLMSVILNEGLKIIGYNAFLNCPISHIKLPETIEDLKGNCLSNTRLSYIIFPKGTKTVDPVAFTRTGSPTKVNHMVCVFLGENTVVTPSEQFPALRGARIIYCLPNSEIQKHAQENFIITKPLSELEEKK